MASKDEINKLLGLVNEITELDIDQLIYDKDWGSINFEAAREDISRLYALCNHFKVLPLDQLPSDIAVQMVSQGAPIKQTITNIRNFTIEQANPSGVRDQYVSNVKQHVDQFYKFAHIYVPYLAYQKGEIQNNIQELTNSVTQAKKLLSDTQTVVTEQRTQIDTIIQAAREASASAGVAHFTIDFLSEAENMENQAKTWLKATVILALSSLCFAIYFLFANPDLSSTAKVVQYVSSKIFILILLITATLWCGNLYKAAKHQSAANKFKGNSLKTFQAFVKATDDNAIRDAVLIETTRAIFSESATGYISTDGFSSEKSTKIVEVVKNTSQTISDMAKS